MKKKPPKKPYWEMTTDELAEATREFDDPNYDPPAIKPTARQLEQLRRWRKKRDRSMLTLSLDRNLISQTDEYALRHGRTISDVVADALKRLIRKKKSA